MALIAKFQADFSNFYSAVQTATSKLDGFQKEADQVAGALDKMTDSLSGREVIQNASLMEKAIADLGGVSKLTDAELRRVGTTVGEASEKMKKMGIEVPQGFKDITQAAEGVKEPTDSWGTSLSTVTGLASAFMASGLVKYLYDAAAAGVAWAGSLTRMHAQTDISYRDLQILQDIAIETSTDLSSLTRTVLVLQERIGDRSAREGIQKLGLSFDAILAMSPGEQFIAIATAIAKIEDPTLRAARAKAVLGNAYREALPAMRANLKEIADGAVIVADDNIEAVDKISTKWNKFWSNQDKSWGEWLGKQARGLQEGMANWDKAIAKGEEYNKRVYGVDPGLPTLPAPIANPVANYRTGGADQPRGFDPAAIGLIEIAGETLAQQTDTIHRNSDAWKDAQAANAKFAIAVDNSLERVRFQHYQLGNSAVTATQNVKGFQIRMSETVAINRDFSKELTASTVHTDKFGHVIETLPPSLGRLGQGLIDVSDETRSFGTTVTDYFKSDFGKNIANAIAGGGNPVKAAVTGLGQAVFSTDGALSKTVSKGVTSIFGTSGMGGKIASTIGSMVPVIGSFVGPALEGLTKVFTKVFGKSEETKSVSPLRDEFFKLQGGIETLNPKVQQLGGSLELVQAVFNAKTVDAYNVAIANLNALFQQEQNALATLTATAEKYGLTIEELGPAMQRQKLDEQAQALYKDWQVLNAAGIQTSVITSRMSDAINKYISDAMKVGTEIPQAMRPMLEQMVAAGQLFDSNGNKIDNLETSGLSFALSMSDGFKALITSVEKLADVLTRSLGVAVDNTTKKINAIPDTISVDVEYNDTNPPHGQSGHVHVPGYATGTGGKFVDFGAGTLAMLHGKEAIVPEGAVMSGGGGGGGGLGGNVTIQIYAQGSFFDTPGDLQRLADKVNDALTAKHSLTNRSRAA